MPAFCFSDVLDSRETDLAVADFPFEFWNARDKGLDGVDEEEWPGDGLVLKQSRREGVSFKHGPALKGFCFMRDDFEGTDEGGGGDGPGSEAGSLLGVRLGGLCIYIWIWILPCLIREYEDGDDGFGCVLMDLAEFDERVGSKGFGWVRRG